MADPPGIDQVRPFTFPFSPFFEPPPAPMSVHPEVPSHRIWIPSCGSVIPFSAGVLRMNCPSVRHSVGDLFNRFQVHPDRHAHPERGRKYSRLKIIDDDIELLRPGGDPTPPDLIPSF
ncbi:hypothetical protein NPIL_538711 [Nephila pilipes]|uniref:Uncharacterized protein n=1 Tax=Nephila pilipes TaxID=299642 RepID=A0A8X6P1J7_NEPPI|nr:hypothetical protein NPIL_538711 [Nephila pilipes]